ncbi:MAG: hypothetical protein DDT20_00540 [Firmicutes bacterium]|nr:hypothetical protein [Bacillota bacterium]
MLFWRTHRSARIIFSLNFHIGEWGPEECIEFLVETVGHDRHTATGEVRRSFNGNYPPLYQAAYMIGAIQIRALHRELIAVGRMTLKEFHASILQATLCPSKWCGLIYLTPCYRGTTRPIGGSKQH